MSNRIKLETYTLRVRPKNKPGQYEQLDDFMNHDNMVAFWADFLDSLKETMSVDRQLQRTLQTPNESTGIHSASPNSGFISGIVESGSFGTASKGKNIDTGDVTYNKTIRDADMMPFFYMLYMPPKSASGALLLQRFGNHSISSIIRKKIKDTFSMKHPGYILEINDLIPREVIKEYIKNGEITELIFRKNMLPREIEDYLYSRNFNVKEAAVHLKLKDRNPLANDSLINWIDSGDPLFLEIPGFKDVGFDDYFLSVMVKKGGSPREIDFSDSMKMRPYFDIHDDVEKDKKTNYPEINSIHSIAKQLILDIFAKEIEFKNGK